MLKANGLQNMVRNIIGVLAAIGAQEEPVIWAREILESKDRTKGGVTAPPCGLYFLGPTYDDHFGLPKTVRIPQIAKDICAQIRYSSCHDASKVLWANA